MRFFRPSISAIGLDLGGRLVKAAQLNRVGEHWQLRAAAVVPRQADETLDQTAQRIAPILDRQGFKGGRAVLAAPVRKVECEMLDLPPRSSGAPIEQLAAMEIGRSARMDIGRYETACWDVPAAARNGGTAVMTLALRHEDADTLVEPLEQHGLEIVAIDALGLALQRACRPLLRDDQACTILDLGWSAASVQVANRQSLLYQRTLWDCGVEYILKTIVADHDLSEEAAELMLRPPGPANAGITPPAWLPTLIRRFADPLCDELGASLAFARQRFPDLCGDQLLLTGGGATLPGLQAMLTDRLKMQVTPVPSSQLVSINGPLAADGQSALLAAAIGLALYSEEP